MERKYLKWHVCPECGTENFTAGNNKASCLECEWKYEGEIYSPSLNDRREPMKTQWISITDRLPRPYVRVLTVLFNGDKWLIVNSVQNTSIQQADGTQVDVIQWEEHNIEVTHWLEGIPAIPDSPQLPTEQRERK